MHRKFRRHFWLLGLVAGVALATPTAWAEQPDLLRFEIEEGQNLNAFYRSGLTAAHLILRSGVEPRILVAFPAGNSGTGLWFAPQKQPVRWTLVRPPEAVSTPDTSGRMLRGVTAEVAVAAATLEVRKALLSSVRVLRDYETANVSPAEVETAARIEGQTVSWARDRLDGAPGYRLTLEVIQGQLAISEDAVRFTPGPDGRIRFRITAMNGETPLKPLEERALLNDRASQDERARNALAFLSYEDKFLAGSWRFNTYFGRDTLMSLRLLMPALQPTAIESGLRSVLERLSPNGEVAHEEDIGEFAVLRHLRESGNKSDAPIYDYGMIDDDFMLAPVVATYLLDDAAGHARARDLLAQTLDDSTSVGAAVVSNALFVVSQSRAFADDPSAANLIRLKPGRTTGQWRDSEAGLGDGIYPYDVNAVFAPAALAAINRLVLSGLLDPYLTDQQRAALAPAAGYAAIWSEQARGHFLVRVSPDQARSAVSNYARSLGVPDGDALAGLGSDGVEFHALALDENCEAVPVVHSDDGFAFLFGEPSPASLERALDAMLRPFPAGLMTDIGLLVANPVFADERRRTMLSRDAYHGTVVWAWQQAVLIAGLDRQIARADLSPTLKARLRQARGAVAAAVTRVSDLRTSELWSWSFEDGRYQVAPFGARSTNEDESNAAQLWSTVFLAIGTSPQRPEVQPRN